MLQNNQQRKSEGFTIIEVMIVLAIAGLIMLIVFLAVPALQRNSRNTQYKNDAASYAAGINEWSQNNDGKMPAAADLTSASGVNSLVKLGTMTAPTTVTAGAQGTAVSAVAIGSLQVNTSAKCDPANVGSTIAGTARTTALRYSVEGSGSATVKQCVDI